MLKDYQLYACMIIFKRAFVFAKAVYCIQNYQQRQAQQIKSEEGSSLLDYVPDLTPFSFTSSKIDLASFICPVLARPSINKQ